MSKERLPPSQSPGSCPTTLMVSLPVSHPLAPFLLLVGHIPRTAAERASTAAAINLSINLIIKELKEVAERELETDLRACLPRIPRLRVLRANPSLLLRSVPTGGLPPVPPTSWQRPAAEHAFQRSRAAHVLHRASVSASVRCRLPVAGGQDHGQ